MKKEIDDCLPKSETDNEFRRMMVDAESLDEGLMAVYMRSVKPDFMTNFKPIKMPYMPRGFDDAIAKYRAIDSKPGSNFKSEAWQEIRRRFSGYFKAKETAASDNNSNRHFLSQMAEFFEEKSMLKQAEYIKQKINQFDQILVAN